MQALGWDDEPSVYFDDLRVHLDDHDIELVIETDPQRVPARLQNERWVCMVTDVLDATSGPVQEKEPHGIWLAKKALQLDIPLYVVTDEPYHAAIRDLREGVPVFSKGTLPGFVASDIKHDLKRRGAWYSEKKVFLIYGHDRKAGDASEIIESKMFEWGLDVRKITGASMSEGIVDDLLKEMSDSAAVVAVCTPDDHVSPPRDEAEYRQPRQNVLLEIGMAMGLSQGLRKLTFIQCWGKDVREQAKLPTNLGGVVTIRFERDADQVGPKLKRRLRDLGLLGEDDDEND